MRLRGDVKDVQEQSFTEQLSAIYVIAKHIDPHTQEVKSAVGPDGQVPKDKVRSFALIYRGEKHQEGPTKLSGPLARAIEIPKDIITDEADIGTGDA